MQWARNGIVVAALCCGIVALWQLGTSGQQPTAAKAQAPVDPNRLEFEVVQSFDAKYEGDTPGHMGRAGGLQTRRPHVALDDTIYRGEQKVGKVTGLTWNRTNGSLDIEFDPLEGVRVRVGDEVWMLLDASAPK